ncbi:unnamed protein product, partial [Musa textilis]
IIRYCKPCFNTLLLVDICYYNSKFMKLDKIGLKQPVGQAQPTGRALAHRLTQ